MLIDVLDVFFSFDLFSLASYHLEWVMGYGIASKIEQVKLQGQKEELVPYLYL